MYPFVLRALKAAALCATAGAAATAVAQPGAYHYIGTLGGQGQEISTPRAIGPGPTVFGVNDYFSNKGNFRRAFVWTPSTGMDPLAGTAASGTASGAYALSGDGSVLVGVLGIIPGSSGPSAQVFRRVNGGPDEPLPLVPGMSYPNVTGISLDGSTTIGVVNGYGGGGRAVTWTGTSAASMLPTLPGAPSAQAYGVNGDGSVVVGASGRGYPFDSTPVRWVNGQIESLGMPPGCSWAWAYSVSADGNTVVGLGWVTGGSSRAFKWTPDTGMTLLESGTTSFAEAWSVSADGRLIGGRIGSEATVWRDGVPHSVPAELLAPGTSLSPFTGLAGNVIISPDGRTIAGSERVVEAPGDGEYHAWALELPGWFTCLTPLITSHPSSIAAGPTGTVEFSVTAESGGTLVYRWEHQTSPGVFAPLVDGPTASWDGGADGVGAMVSGSHTSTLTISADSSNGRALASVHAGPYRCVVLNDCGQTGSFAAMVTVCVADFDSNGFVNGDDFDAFVAAFELGDAMADIDSNTFVNGDDFDTYVVAFEAGC